jgi:DNA-binding protein H-NS
MSEDEGGIDDEPAVKFDEEKAAAARKAREEREQKLREMMEADGISARRDDYDILLTMNSRHARRADRRRERLSRCPHRQRSAQPAI